MNHTPGISVVVPTYGRPDYVEALLTSLQEAASAYGGDSEVLVVDSSTGQQKEHIQLACKRSRARYEWMPNNVRVKRNWGAEQARFPIVLFIDSDCQATVNLLCEHARIYAQDESPNLGGVVGLTQFVGDDNWVWQIITHASILDSFSFAEHHDVVPWGPTCNMSYRREVIERVGLFDTSFPFVLGGDDTDLGVRVTDAGFRLVTNRHAVVTHDKKTWSSVSLIGKRVFRWGRMHYHVMRKHPHRVTTVPPTVPGALLVLILIFLPLGLLSESVIWSALPFVWLGLVLTLESVWTSRKMGMQPKELFYTFGSYVLGLVYEFGTVLEGIKNLNPAPFYKNVSCSPPSYKDRSRGITELWAMTLAFPLATALLILGQLACRSR